MTLRITYQGMTLKQLRDKFPQSLVSRALNRAQNRTLASAHTALSGKIRQDYAIKASDVNAIKTLKSANKTNPDAVLTYIGKRLPLKAFNPRQKNIRVSTVHGKKARRKQVTVKVKKTQRRIAITSVPAFLGKSGDVFYRTTKERFPIRKAFVISIPEMMLAKEQQELFSKVVQERMPAEFTQNMNHFLSQLAGS